MSLNIFMQIGSSHYWNPLSKFTTLIMCILNLTSYDHHSLSPHNTNTNIDTITILVLTDRILTN